MKPRGTGKVTELQDVFWRSTKKSKDRLLGRVGSWAVADPPPPPSFHIPVSGMGPTPQPTNPSPLVSTSDNGPTAAMTFSIDTPSVNSHFLPWLPPVGLWLQFFISVALG